LHTHAPEARAVGDLEVAVDSEAVGSEAVGWAGVGWAVEAVRAAADDKAGGEKEKGEQATAFTPQQVATEDTIPST